MRAFRRRKAEQQGIAARARRDLPGLHDWGARLQLLAEEVAGRIAFVPGDPQVLMACFFLHRQIDHMRSLQILGVSRDTRLIARSMIEGAAQFAWACQDFPARAERWRRYAYIHEWRKLRSRRLDGEPEDASRQTMIEHQIATFGEEFYTGSAQAAKRFGKALPANLYVDVWAGLSVRDIFEQVDFGDRNMGQMYVQLYSDFSDWQHWNISGLDEGMLPVNGQFSYSSGDPAEASSALRAGIFSLLVTLDLVDQQLHLAAGRHIIEMAQAYNEWWEQQKHTPIVPDAAAL